MTIPPDVRRLLDDAFAGVNYTVGEVSLATTPATTTTVPCRGCSQGSAVFLSPINAAAAAEAGAGGLYVTPGTQQFIVTHSASGSARAFRYAAFRNARQL